MQWFGRAALGCLAVAAMTACTAATPTAATPTAPSPSSSSSVGTPAASAPTAASSEESNGPASARLIDHTRWTSTDKGRQLQVFPTSAGRSAPDGDGGTAWKQILADAPDANTPGMYDQFLCHWEFARLVDPNKTSWNLEPWRPAVGWTATVAAECNPGGSEG